MAQPNHYSSVKTCKRQCEKRPEFADLKQKFPSLSTKADDELLHDNERVVKKPKTEAVGCVESLFP